MSITRVVVLVNRRSGAGTDAGPSAEEITDAFASAGVEAPVDEVDPHHLPATIGLLWAAPDRPDAIVVAGGDGTVGHAAGAVAGTDVVLGVLPTGTFNHFAKDLGIPVDLIEAARALAGAEVVAVDVAEVNGRTFVNNAVLGVYPEMLRARDRLRSRHGWGKVRAVAVASAAVLRLFPTHRVDISGPGGVVRRGVRTPLLFVGNGVYAHAGIGLPARGSLTDGVLGLAVTRATTRRGLVRAGLHSLRRGGDAPGDVETIEVPELTVTARPRTLRVGLDGELAMVTTPLRFRVRPGALRVLVPLAVQPEPEAEAVTEPGDVPVGVADGIEARPA
jgi:diacylglycerol kinase family enzyme